MELSAAQQERYSRHVLLDGLGGDGQERLLSSRVRVRGQGAAALWAARYLAAAGVGALIVEDCVASECRPLNGDVSISVGDAPADLELAPEGGAFEGAKAALEAVVRLARSAG
jgi:adenylyltransferase/sulfurtransferase